MKKRNLFLILALLCCSSTPLIAQLRWYAECGLNYPFIQGGEFRSNPELYSTNPDVYMSTFFKEEYTNKVESQWIVGVTLQKKWINIDVELEYSRLRFEIKEQRATQFTSLSSSYLPPQLTAFVTGLSIRYLSLPMMVNVHSFNNLFAVGIGLVPQIYLPPSTMHSMYGGIKEFSCAVQAQMKWQVSTRISVISAYRQSLTNLYNSDFPISTETKSRMVQLSLRYYFGKKI